eukprot:2899642-Pyramimonas_sp.AAC.1
MSLRESMRIATLRWLFLRPLLYVDDSTIAASGFSGEALAAASRGTEFFVDVREVPPVDCFADEVVRSRFEAPSR